MSQIKGNENWVGVQYTNINDIPYFKDIIGNSSRLLPNQLYGVSDNVKNGKHFVFLERLLTSGPKKFKIIQVLKVGELKSDEVVNISGGCKINGKNDEYIIAIVKVDSDKEVLIHIKKAWKINLENHRFVPINSKKIICANEGFGV